MPRDLQFRATLREWFAGQTKYKSLREAANGIGMPFDTLRGYFSGKRPSDKNLKVLIGATGLELHPAKQSAKSQKVNLKSKIYASQLLDELQYDLARCIASIPAVQTTLHDGVPREKLPASRRKGRQIQSLMDALQRSLEAIVNHPDALELVRKTVSGSDAGYLCSAPH